MQTTVALPKGKRVERPPAVVCPGYQLRPGLIPGDAGERQAKCLKSRGRGRRNVRAPREPFVALPFPTEPLPSADRGAFRVAGARGTYRPDSPRRGRAGVLLARGASGLLRCLLHRRLREAVAPPSLPPGQAGRGSADSGFSARSRGGAAAADWLRSPGRRSGQFRTDRPLGAPPPPLLLAWPCRATAGEGGRELGWPRFPRRD